MRANALRNVGQGPRISSSWPAGFSTDTTANIVPCGAGYEFGECSSGATQQKRPLLSRLLVFGGFNAWLFRL